MLVAGLTVIVLVGLVIYVLVSNVDSLSKPFLKLLGYLLIIVSFVELLILLWVLIYIGISDWSLWGLSFDTFWREQLSAIYFIKEWLYTWFWNDLLNLAFVEAAAKISLNSSLRAYVKVKSYRTGLKESVLQCTEHNGWASTFVLCSR